MIKISMLYPNLPNSRFDMAYYFEKHMPASIARLSVAKGFRSVSVDRGLDSGPPGVTLAYIAMCHYVFDSIDDFLAAFRQHADFLQSDIGQYSDIAPVIQFSEVVIAKPPFA